jgi:catalase
MSYNQQSPTSQAQSLSMIAILFRLAIIGFVMLILVGSFAYTGGWFSPHRLTPQKFIHTFETVNGVYSGFRRNHAKGICVSGFFDSNGEGVGFSKASVFKQGHIPIIGRFALAGGNPFVSDTPSNVRSLALLFFLPHGEEWRTAMNNIPVFSVNSAKGFHDQIIATHMDPATGKPDPLKMNAFLAAHPEAEKAIALIKKQPIASGFDNATYNSLNAFRFVNAKGSVFPVRWSMVSLQPFKQAAPVMQPEQDKNYLFDALIASIHQHTLRWKLIVTIGEATDPTNDATLAWPSQRKQVDVGTLTITHIEGETNGTCRDVNFDPLVLPSGILPSDDPLLSARSAVYARSFTKRVGEKKEPSAVQINPNSKSMEP